MTITDAHCHVGEGEHKSQTPEQLVRCMDRCEVERAVICGVEEHLTVFNREGNDYLLKAMRQFPDRLRAFACANPWFKAKAVEELRRALEGGCRGLKINSFRQGFLLSDELLDPLLEVCEESGVPVYCHTGTLICSEPFQLLELARRFPKVNFIMGHSGFADYWNDALPAAQKVANIYLETSFIDIGNIKAACRALGCERLLFGSDSPVSDMSLELGKLKRLKLAPEDLENILGGNIMQLLEI